MGIKNFFGFLNFNSSEKKGGTPAVDYLSMIENIIDHEFCIFGDSFAKDQASHLNDSSLKTLINQKNFYIGKKVPITKLVYTSALSELLAKEYILLQDFFLMLL